MKRKTETQRAEQLTLGMSILTSLLFAINAVTAPHWLDIGMNTLAMVAYALFAGVLWRESRG